MNGTCPNCGRTIFEECSTTNEWKFVCKPCDVRFNRDGLLMPPFETIVRFYEYGTDVVGGGCVSTSYADDETAVSPSK